MECRYCSKVYKNNNNSLRNHERLCKSNPNAQVLKSNLIEYRKKKKEFGIKGTNQYIKAKQLGLPNLRVFKLKEINAIKNNTFWPVSALAHNELKP